MSGPRVKRYGDSWDLAWDEIGLGIQFERVREKADDLGCMVRVESIRPGKQGRILGPQRMNLMSATGQQNLSKALIERLPELKIVAFSVVTTSCAVVVEQYMKPSPTVYTDEVLDFGPRIDQAPMMPVGETTLAYGDSESAKSLLVQRIGLSVQYGIPLPWGKTLPLQGNVLICDWETNQRAVTERLWRLGAGLPEPIARPRIAYRGILWRQDVPPLRLLEDELPALREQIVREHIDLVIVDSIGFAVRGKLVDDDVARQAMIDLRTLSPATRLVVAHISKESANKDRGRVDPFGSAFFRAGVRSAFEVRRADEDVRENHISVGIFHWKNNDGVHTPPFGLGIDFDGTEGPITFTTEDLMTVPDLAARTSLSNRLYQLLRGGAMDTVELAGEVDAEVDAVNKALKRDPRVMQLVPGGGRGKPAVWGLKQQP